jgi:hypothetical protein
MGRPFVFTLQLLGVPYAKALQREENKPLSSTSRTQTLVLFQTEMLNTPSVHREMCAEEMRYLEKARKATRVWNGSLVPGGGDALRSVTPGETKACLSQTTHAHTPCIHTSHTLTTHTTLSTHTRTAYTLAFTPDTFTHTLRHHARTHSHRRSRLPA